MSAAPGTGGDEPEDLLRRARAGDAEAGVTLFIWIWEFTRDEVRPSHPDLADDLATDFARLMTEDKARRLGGFDHRIGSLVPYLRKSIWHEVSARERRSAREVCVDPTEENSVLDLKDPREADDPEVRTRLKRALEEFLGALFDKDRLVLTMVSEGWYQREIASILGEPEGTVASRISRLKKRLLKFLLGRGFSEGRESC